MEHKIGDLLYDLEYGLGIILQCEEPVVIYAVSYIHFNGSSKKWHSGEDVLTRKKFLRDKLETGMAILYCK